MEHRPSLETNRSKVSLEIPCILWNPKVHYLIHKSPPSVPILVRSTHTMSHLCHSISLRSILILSSHLHLGISNGGGAKNSTVYYTVVSDIYFLKLFLLIAAVFMFLCCLASLKSYSLPINPLIFQVEYTFSLFLSSTLAILPGCFIVCLQVFEISPSEFTILSTGKSLRQTLPGSFMRGKTAVA
jgi:hypothetical protein